MRLQLILAASILLPSAVSSITARGADAPERVTYEDDVKPILRQHCFSCHNQNERKSGLALDSFASTIEGGAGGEVVFDGDAESSRLWQLIAHEDTPVMPPEQDKLPDEKIAVVRSWIDGGLLENAGSKAKKKKSTALAFSASADGRPEGPAAMPETVWKQPAVVTDRPAAATAIQASPWAPLVAIGGQQQVVLYNTDTGQLAGILPFPEGEPQSLTFSRDGSYLLVGGGQHSSQGLTVLYDVRTGNRVARVGDELDIVLGSDTDDTLSRVALGGPQRLVRIHDMASGSVAFELKKHTDWVYAVRYSPDGILLASGDRAGGLVVWESGTGRLYADFAGHKDAVRGLAWRADSNLLASASLDGTVKLWDIVNGKELSSFSAHGGGVTSIDMARDGSIVTGGKDRVVKVWDGSGKLVREFPAMPEAVLEVAFSHDAGSVIAGDWSGQVQMWKTADPAQATILASNPRPLEERLAAAEKAAQQSAAAHTAAAAALAAVDGELMAATKALEGLQAQLAAAGPAAQAAEAARVQTRAAADAAAALLAAEGAARGTLEKQVADLTAQVAAHTTAQAAAQQQLAQMETKHKEAVAARDASTAELAAIDAQAAELQTDAAANAEKIAELQTQRGATAEQHAQKAAAVVALEAEVAKAGEQNRVATETLQKTQQMLTAQQTAMTALQTRISELTAANEMAETAAVATATEAKRLADQMTMFEAQRVEADKKVGEVTARRDGLKPPAEQTAAASAAAAATVDQLKSDLQAFATETERLAAARAAVEKTLAENKSLAEAKQAEAVELTGRVTAEDEKLAALRQQLEQLQTQVSELKATKRQLETTQAEAAQAAETAEAEMQKMEDRRALYEAAYSAK